MDKNNPGLFIVAIVAVVAVVALVLMFNGSKDVSDYFASEDTVVSGEESAALAGQAVRSRELSEDEEKELSEDESEEYYFYENAEEEKKERTEERMEEVVELSCTDSDGFEPYDSFTLGYTSGTHYLSGITYTSVSDTCMQNDQLKEFICRVDGTLYQEYRDCPNGCQDGVCMEFEGIELGSSGVPECDSSSSSPIYTISLGQTAYDILYAGQYLDITYIRKGNALLPSGVFMTNFTVNNGTTTSQEVYGGEGLVAPLRICERKNSRNWCTSSASWTPTTYLTVVDETYPEINFCLHSQYSPFLFS